MINLPILTSSLSINSQTPSEARTRNLSSDVNFHSDISGSERTPTDAAIWSPKDLVIARPGMSSDFSHTLGGPINSSSSSNNNLFF